MATKRFALIRVDGVVDSIIVVGDQTEDGWLEGYLADRGLDRAVDTDEITRPIGPGFIYRQGRGYVPPVELHADPAAVPADGATAATVTYVDNRPDPPAEVLASVNGLEQPIALVDGRGQLQVASRTAGDEVTVRVDGAEVTVTVGDA